MVLTTEISHFKPGRFFKSYFLFLKLKFKRLPQVLDTFLHFLMVFPLKLPLHHVCVSLFNQITSNFNPFLNNPDVLTWIYIYIYKRTDWLYCKHFVVSTVCVKDSWVRQEFRGSIPRDITNLCFFIRKLLSSLAKSNTIANLHCGAQSHAAAPLIA